MRLKKSGAGGKVGEEVLEVVLHENSAGESLAVPEQLRRSLEQICLRLTRENWLLFYESLAAEAQLRARAMVHRCRTAWLAEEDCPVRCLNSLEAELLHLPIFEVGAERRRRSGTQPTATPQQAEQDEQRLREFLCCWEEHEAWAVALEEHLGPLDLEVSRERSNNLQQKTHTPYSVDLCRLAFRNFAVCEGRLFFRLALAMYGLIVRLVEAEVDDAAYQSRLELLESLYTTARRYTVPDDSLARQRLTQEEYTYYLFDPLRRACRLLADGVLDDDEEEEGWIPKG